MFDNIDHTLLRRALKFLWPTHHSLHRRRDVLWGEDANQIRSDAAPQAMAILRNTMRTIANLFGSFIPAVYSTCAENLCAATATVKNGFL